MTLIKDGLEAHQGEVDEMFTESILSTSVGVIHFFNIYLPPGLKIGPMLLRLDRLIRDKKCILSGDFNARSSLWGDRVTDSRSAEVSDFILTNNLHLCNDGLIPTFETVNGKSFIDLTLTSDTLRELISSWEVKEVMDDSDHRSIVMVLSLTPEPVPPREVRFISNSSSEKLSRLAKRWSISWSMEPSEIESYLIELTASVQSCLSRKTKHVTNFKSFPWWSPEITSLRNHTRAQRRRYQKFRGRHPDQQEGINRLKALYLKKARDLKKLITTSKHNSWKKFLENDQEMWGAGFRSVFHAKENKNPKLIKDPDLVLQQLFPPRTVNNWDLDLNTLTMDDLEITEEEIDMAFSSTTKKGKAPGIDGIPARAWFLLHEGNKQILVSLFNDIYYSGVFPKSWKLAKVVLIPKPDKASYRPISLLSTISKIFEKVLLSRVNFYISSKFDNRQFGFRIGKSTTDALERLMFFHESTRAGMGNIKYGCLLLDIKGAFNNFDPVYCLKQLDLVGCPRNITLLLGDYLRQRTLQTEGFEMTICNGAPQGSCLAPLLWNMNVEGLLRMVPPDKDTIIQAFADDILVYSRSREHETVNANLRRITDICSLWALRAGVIFAQDKCQLLTRDARITASLDGHLIERVEKAKYLGIMLDSALSSAAHIEYLRQKSSLLSTKLGRIFGRKYGIQPKFAKSIYKQVIEPSLLYGCSAWFENTERKIASLTSAQRSPLLKITRCFRTTSTKALQVLAGVVPIDLKIIELSRLRYIGKYMPIDKRRFPVIYPGRIPFKAIDCSPIFEGFNIFTDGSKSDEGVGASMIVTCNHSVIVTEMARLEPSISNFQAEVQGIRMAISFCILYDIEATIFTDSLSAIQALTGFGKHDSIVCEVIEQASRSGRKFKIAWIKAHVGNFGNEEADAAAKEAVINGTPITLKPSLSHFKAVEKKRTIKDWSKVWRLSDKGRTTFHFFPDISNKRLFSNFHINMMLTGHGYFPNYLFRFNLRRVRCTCGTRTKYADVFHILQNCDQFLGFSRKLCVAPDLATRLLIFEAWGQELERIYYLPPGTARSNRVRPRAHPYRTSTNYRDEYAGSDD